MRRRWRLWCGLLLPVVCVALSIPLGNTLVVQRNIDRLWLHRTNTVEKLYEFENRYRHFECDVLFQPEAGEFCISHDELTPVSLRPYLVFLGKNPDRRLWLDFKNLTAENSRAADSLLTAWLESYAVEKAQLIVESRDWPALRRFTDEGYYTSCYLDIPGFDRSMPAALRAHVLDSIAAIASGGAVKALSFPASYYPHLRDRDYPVDLLTWEHRRWPWQLPLLPRSRALLNDDRVKVILVKQKGHYHQ